MKEIRLAEFREKVQQYDRYTVRFSSIFSPISSVLEFDRVYVSLDPIACVCLGHDASHICIRHIASIEKSTQNFPEETYKLVCYDHSFQTPCKKVVEIDCAKIS